MDSFRWKICRGSAAEHVLYFKCHRKYYNVGASENIFSVALAYNGISIIVFNRPGVAGAVLQSPPSFID